MPKNNKQSKAFPTHKNNKQSKASKTLGVKGTNNTIKKPTSQNTAPLLSGVDLPQLKSDKLTNEFFFGKGVNTTLKELRKKNGLNVPKNARALYERTDPDSQCIRCIGDPTDATPCYICKLMMKNLENSGFYYDDKTKKTKFLWTGRQCEHIIPVLMMAIICGLCDYKGGQYPVSPDKSRTRYFNKLMQAFPEEKENIEKLMENYKKWQEYAWILSYAWSHTECNMVKNEFPFIQYSIQWTDPNKPSLEVKNDIFEANLRNLLRMLLFKGENIWCDMFRAVYRGDIFQILTSDYADEPGIKEQVDRWIEDTIEIVKRDNLQPLIDHLQRNESYINISLSILKDTICGSLFDDKTAIEEVLGADTVIAKLIHISKERLIAKGWRGGGQGGGAEPETEMESMRKDKDNEEKYQLANILINLPLDPRQGLRRTETLTAVEALLILQQSEDEDEDPQLMTKEYIEKLINEIFEANENSEIIAGAIYLMYMYNSNKNGNNPYSKAIQIVNNWMNGMGGDYESEFNFLIKRIKEAYGEIIIKDHLIGHAPLPRNQTLRHTSSVLDVLKDVERSMGGAKKRATTIICGIDRVGDNEVKEVQIFTLAEIFDAINRILPKSMALQKKKKNTKRKKKKKQRRKSKMR